MPNKNTTQEVIVKPQLKWLTLSYVIFSLPGFIAGIVWIFISIFLLIGVVAASSVTTVPDNDELVLNTIEDSRSNKGILVYDLKGAIDTGDSSQAISGDGIMTEVVERDFENIKNDNSIVGVVFRLNTPGGTIFASEVLGDLVNDLMESKNQEQPVFFYDQLVASGGLWSSYKANNSYIVGSPYGETGSIGVVLTLPNFSELADKVGYSETVIKSSGSKDIGNPLREPSVEEKDFLSGRVNENYDKFIDIVANSRGLESIKVREFANGFVYPNDQAKEFGLIDEIGDLNKAIEKVASNLELERYDVFEIEPQTSPFQDLFGGSPLLQNITKTQENLSKPFALQPSTLYAIDINKL